MDSVWIQELTWEDVAEYLKERDDVIVPIGSTEAHGPHLPLGTDSYEAIDYAEEIGRQAQVLVAPPIWYGDAYWHMQKPGTLAVQPETVIALLKDIYSSLIEHGFKKIITFNGHRLANLPAIGIASRAIKYAHPDVIFASMDPLTMVGTHLKLREAVGSGIHGDEFETSHMLLKHPDLVKRDKFVFSHGYFFETPFISVDALAGGDTFQIYHSPADQGRLAPVGHIGDPTKASVEKGQQLFDAVVNAGVAFIDDLRRWAETGYEIHGATSDEGRELLRREQEWRAARIPK